MRLLVIVNPAASRGSRTSLAPNVSRAFQATGLDFVIEPTQSPGDATRIVAEHGAAFEGIVVCGGDGTLHEALQAVDLQRHVVGLIPRGTGNDFAAMNDWPHDIEACARRIAAHDERHLDIGIWGERRFHNSVGIGFEGRVNYESHRIRFLRGPAVYFAALARTLAQRRADPLDMKWDGGSWNGPTFMVSVCIGRRVGGAFHLAPQADNRDGQFDVCYAGALGLFHLMRVLPRTLSGTHLRDRDVHLVRGATVHIDAPSGVPVHIDGEFVGLDVREIHLRTLPGALRTF
jgi:YegS/Rv2252/BmrU family lipid kinase